MRTVESDMMLAHDGYMIFFYVLKGAVKKNLCNTSANTKVNVIFLMSATLCRRTSRLKCPWFVEELSHMEREVFTRWFLWFDPRLNVKVMTTGRVLFHDIERAMGRSSICVTTP